MSDRLSLRSSTSLVSSHVATLQSGGLTLNGIQIAGKCTDFTVDFLNFSLGDIRPAHYLEVE